MTRQNARSTLCVSIFSACTTLSRSQVHRIVVITLRVDNREPPTPGGTRRRNSAQCSYYAGTAPECSSGGPTPRRRLSMGSWEQAARDLDGVEEN
jgi:hypothetical protein